MNRASKSASFIKKPRRESLECTCEIYNKKSKLGKPTLQLYVCDVCSEKIYSKYGPKSFNNYSNKTRK